MSKGAPEKWFQRVIAALPRVSPEYVFGFRAVTLDKPKPAIPKWLLDAVMIVQSRAPGRSLQLTVSLEKDGSRKSLKALLNTVKPTGEVPLSVTEMPNPSQAWRAMIAMAQFLADPGTSTLARTLEHIADAYEELDSSIGLVNVPWPLESILRFASSEQELRDFAKRVRDGELGNFQEWVQAENRWLKKEVSEEDLLWLTGTWTPYDSSIASCGLPHGAFHILDNDKLSQECLVRVFKLMPEGRHRACFGRLILYLNLNPMHPGQEPVRFTHDVLQDLITYSGDEHFFMDFLLWSENPREFIVSYGDAIKNAFAAKYLYAAPFGFHDGSDRQRHHEMMRLLCELYSERSLSRRWLLGPIAVLAVSGFEMQVPLKRTVLVLRIASGQLQ